MIRGEHTGDTKVHQELRRKKTLKRIKEYEKFEVTCLRLRELEEARRQSRRRMRRRNTLVEGRLPRVVVIRKAHSVSHSDQSAPANAGLPEIGRGPGVSLAGRLYLLSLVRLWRARAQGRRPRAGSLPAGRAPEPPRRSSLPAAL